MDIYDLLYKEGYLDKKNLPKARKSEGYDCDYIHIKDSAFQYLAIEIQDEKIDFKKHIKEKCKQIKCFMNDIFYIDGFYDDIGAERAYRNLDIDVVPVKYSLFDCDGEDCSVVLIAKIVYSCDIDPLGDYGLIDDVMDYEDDLDGALDCINELDLKNQFKKFLDNTILGHDYDDDFGGFLKFRANCVDSEKYYIIANGKVNDEECIEDLIDKCNYSDDVFKDC